MRIAGHMCEKDSCLRGALLVSVKYRCIVENVSQHELLTEHRTSLLLVQKYGRVHADEASVVVGAFPGSGSLSVWHGNGAGLERMAIRIREEQ